MTVKNVIEQVEKLFGRQSEKYMYQLINDALDDIASTRKNYTLSSITNLEQKKRWYELEDRLISIKRVEIKDTNDRYVLIPKLADSHKILREDTEASDDTLT